MERYKKGKSRFLVGTTSGQPGYAVFRLDGRWRDRNLTPVYDKIRTRQRAEQVARRCADQGVSVTNTKFHIPLESKQEQMRRRHDLASTRPYSIDELVELHGLSRRTVISLYENEAGIQILNRPETVHKRRFRTIHVPHYVYERVRIKLEAHG